MAINLLAPVVNEVCVEVPLQTVLIIPFVLQIPHSCRQT